MGAWDRTILHVDIDAFFVQVERLAAPQLRRRPLLVGGGLRGRGTVACACYEARGAGVRAGMPIERALRLCPEAAVVGCHPGRVREASARFLRVLLSVTPNVERASLDEAFLDLTDGPATLRVAIRRAREIQREIAGRLSLSTSVGIAPTKALAKAASGLGKPGGWAVLDADRFRHRFGDAPVERLSGVGPATATVLRRAGIRRIEDLVVAPADRLRRIVGTRGEALQRAARGTDSDPVVAFGEARPGRTLGREITLPRDVRGAGNVQRVLLALAEEVAADLREEGLRAGAVHGKLRYADRRTMQRSVSLADPTEDASTLFATVSAVLGPLGVSAPVRTVGIVVSRLERAKRPRSGALFGENRQARFERVADRLRAERGRRALRRAVLLPEKQR